MPVGPVFSWVDPRTQPESIADIIYMMDWKEAPLLNILGFNSANVDRLIPGAAWPSLKPQWFNDSLPPGTTALSGIIDTSQTTIGVTAGTGVYFRKGDIVVMRDADGGNAILEHMLVTDKAADSITVIRNYPAGGTGSAGAASDPIERTTRSQEELSSPDPSYVTEVAESWNAVQIIEDTVTVSRSSEVAKKIGYESEMMRRIEKRFVNRGTAGVLAQELENTFFYGQRDERESDGTSFGTMGGFDTFVNTNVIDASAAVLTEDLVRTALRGIHMENGTIDFALMSPLTGDFFDTLWADRIRTTVDERRGGSAMSSIVTSYGELNLVSHRRCPDGVIYFVNREDAGWLPYDPFFVKDNDELRDGDTKRIIGEYTFALRNEEGMAKLHNFVYA